MNFKNVVFSAPIFACALLPIFSSAAFSAEPAWWTKQKRDCGLPPNLAYNSWDGRCNRGVQSPAQIDPRQIALQNAATRYQALVRSLSDRYNLLDKQSWLNLPLGTEAAFFSSANQLHKLLVDKTGAYHSKDRQAIEHLLTDDFTFTSPRDDHIDRQLYFERCWPTSEASPAYTIERLFEQGNEAFVRYKAELNTGKVFRNTELLRFDGNKIAEVDVYFGRTIKEASEN